MSVVKGFLSDSLSDSESDLFNKLESVAMSSRPTTPVLGCSISRALETRFTGNNVSSLPSLWDI